MIAYHIIGVRGRPGPPFLLPRGDRIWYKYMFRGGMAERLKAAVLKTAGRRRPAGSNPAPSARIAGERWPSRLKATAC